MSNLLVAIAISKHLSVGEYNSVHPHIKYQNESFIAGAYVNSTYNLSAYVGFEFDYDKHALELGLATGYFDTGLTPYARYTYEVDDDYQLFIAPSVEIDQFSNIYYGSVIGVEIFLKK